MPRTNGFQGRQSAVFERKVHPRINQRFSNHRLLRMLVSVCGDNDPVFDCEILWRDPVAKQHLTGATVQAVQVHRGREVIKRSAALPNTGVLIFAAEAGPSAISE